MHRQQRQPNVGDRHARRHGAPRPITAYDGAGQLTGAGVQQLWRQRRRQSRHRQRHGDHQQRDDGDANSDYKCDKEGELTEADSTVMGSSEKSTYAWSPTAT